LFDDFKKPGFSVQARAGRRMLPLKQETHELGGRDRLDFFAQPPDRQAMNPGEQAAMTKLVRSEG